MIPRKYASEPRPDDPLDLCKDAQLLIHAAACVGQ